MKPNRNDGERPKLHKTQEAREKLRRLDFLVQHSQLSGNAPPFLGLALDDEKLPEARIALSALSDWKLSKLLNDFSYVCGWAICATLSERYGEDGNREVWPHIESLLDRTLCIQNDRHEIFNAFVRSCRKLGLASDGFDRRVDAFQIHAGVSRKQLVHLAKAFIAQERSNGLPDQDDIVHLNRWEDDALHFLAAGIEVPRRPILMDHSAWMAAAYVEWRKDEDSFAGKSGKSSYLRHFGETLRTEFESSGGAVKRVVAAPRLVWEDGRPWLAIPGQSRRFRLHVDGVLRRVRSGHLWPLPYPLPTEVSWNGENSGRIVLFHGSEFVLFDSNTGRQVTIKSIDGKNRISGVVATAIVVSRKAFQVDGIPAREVGQSLFCADADLRAGSVELTREDKRWLLTGVRRPQISIQGLPIAKGLSGSSLWGPSTEVELDFGSSELLPGHMDGMPRQAFVAVDACGRSDVIEVEADGRGIATIKLSKLSKAVDLSEDSDPALMMLTLFRSQDVSSKTERTSTRFKRKLVVWPGFQAQEGLVFLSRKAPGNFVELESMHVSRDERGNLCLDRKGGFSEGRLAFDLDGDVGLFTVRPAVLSAILERVNGTNTPWTMGDPIIKGAATKNDAIVINSPDKGASLKIGSCRVSEPFRYGPTYAIPIATLDGGDISHVSSKGLPTLVATVESAEEPIDVSMNIWEGGTRISIEMPFHVGGVEVRLETEEGQIDQSEIGLDRLPVKKPPRFWLAKHEADGNRFTFEMDGRSLVGMNLIALRLRRIGQPEWFQLGNARNDRYAFPLKGGAPPSGSALQHDRLDRIDDWLSKCYAPVVWDRALGGALKSRWSESIEEIVAKPGGTSRLLLLAVKDEEPDWLPLQHVIQEVPTLFAEPAIGFHVFSDSSGSDRVLGILADTRSKRIRDLNLDPMALVAFSNARTAEKTGEPLKNFKPSRLPAIFSTLSEKPKEWLGIKALGPDHAATAAKLLLDRIEEYKILGAGEAEGRMYERSANLNRVASIMRDSSLEDRCVSPKDDNDASIHMVEQALLTFAVASRRGSDKIRELLHRTSTELGCSERDLLASIGQLIRLGRELFAFHLIAAELESRSAT